MTDDLGPLRQAMSDLAEHGGSTDLYERSLRTSRRTQRRTAVTAGVAAVAVVFAIVGAVAFAGADRPGPSVPVATRSPAPIVTTTSAAPSAAPSMTPPSSTPPSSEPPSTAPTSERPRYPDCPSAKTLEGLVDLPKDKHFVASSIECWRTWATAEAKGPIPSDGVYLFRYKSSTGWKYHSQGSAFNCQDLGITSGNPPFCGTD